MSKAKPWIMIVTVRPGEDREAMERAITKTHYRGLTWHETKGGAKAEADRVLNEAVKVAPTLRWCAIWAKPALDLLPFQDQEGKCCSTTREPRS